MIHGSIFWASGIMDVAYLDEAGLVFESFIRFFSCVFFLCNHLHFIGKMNET